MMVDISDKEANELLEEYSQIVHITARNAYSSSLAIDFADLCQVGYMAVLKAVKSYDPSYGTNIKSFVTKIVRQEIFNEAARFLGVFTVDHRVTALAAKANRLYDEGKNDEEIADILSRGSRNFDNVHVRDLRLAYNRRQHVTVENDIRHCTEEENIQELLNSVPRNDKELAVMNMRILEKNHVNDVAESLSLSVGQVYEIEKYLKEKICQAIRETI